MMRIDPNLNHRAETHRFNAARQRLEDKILSVTQAADLPLGRRRDLAYWLGQQWQEALILQADHAVVLQRYVLIQMTRHLWQRQLIYAECAARMIGIPSENWRLSDGVTAVYRHIVAAHFLKPDMVEFIETEAAI